eukprot:1898679-Rhodomonas_salina.2
MRCLVLTCSALIPGLNICGTPPPRCRQVFCLRIESTGAYLPLREQRLCDYQSTCSTSRANMGYLSAYMRCPYSLSCSATRPYLSTGSPTYAGPPMKLAAGCEVPAYARPMQSPVPI